MLYNMAELPVHRFRFRSARGSGTPAIVATQEEGLLPVWVLDFGQLYQAAPVHPFHRRDSIQGTDYIANYFFLNLRVSRAKIKKSKINNQWR